MEIILVAAVAKNLTIGNDNDLVWRNKEDMARFRVMTTGHTVVMGRKTWASLPPAFRPLPGRRNIVVSRDPLLHLEGAEVYNDVEHAIAAAMTDEANVDNRVYVIGGAEIYKLALPLATHMRLTRVDQDLEGNKVFPQWSDDDWELKSVDPREGYAFVFYARRGYGNS